MSVLSAEKPDVPLAPTAAGTIRILTFSSLFPNSVNPGHGIFVENRLRHLLADAAVEAHVVAPVPWFPFRSPRFGAYGGYARVPAAETRHGVAVTHPRYPAIPKFGMTLAPHLMARWAEAPIRALIASGFAPDIIDAHYFYPDGVAAGILARRLGLPFVVTARGTDVNVFPDFDKPRRMILATAEAAAAVITVSEALRRRLIDLGADGAKIRTLRNGVDLQAFVPLEQASARAALGIAGPVVATVGNVLEAKGQRLAVEAIGPIADAHLVIVGDGPDVGAVRARAEALGIAGRVHFLGRVPQDQLKKIYSAADVSVLASAREGWPNVLLESMACGTPGVATNVGGVAEIITRPQAGTIVDARRAGPLSAALAALLRDPPDRAATRAHAEDFAWQATSRGQYQLFADILAR